MTGSPGFSRLDACRDSGILPGTPDPTEAGTPAPGPRSGDYSAAVHALRTFFNVHQVALRQCRMFRMVRSFCNRRNRVPTA